MPHVTRDGHRLYSTAEVADQMRVVPATVWRWVKAGKIVPWLVGVHGDMYFTVQDTHRFMESFARTPGPYVKVRRTKEEGR